ncbi:MAG: serine hydrolase [Pirellulaceae bacterium]
MLRNTFAACGSVVVMVSLLAAVPFAAVQLEAEESSAFYPAKQWTTASPRELGLDAHALTKARDYALTGGGSGIVTRDGRVAMVWGDPARRYDLKSTTKSIGVTALGLAMMDGKIRLEDKAQRHQPEIGRQPVENQKTGWLERITIAHLATQTAGFEKPGGYTRLLFEPGTKWDYSDSGPNWLAECVTLAYRRDVRDLLFERVFEPIGIGPSDLTWRDNSYREKTLDGVPRREFGSGVSANVDAMARLGYLYLRRGKWKDRQLLPAEFVDQCRATPPQLIGLPEHQGAYDNASDHYGLLWWNNADGALPGVPRDAYWSWGLYDSLIVVIPSLDIVAARAGRSWKRERDARHYDVLAPFLTPLAAAVQGRNDSKKEDKGEHNAEQQATNGPRVIGIDFAPQETILRLAGGSDNWPTTWGDDDAQYTAYGDGWGFKPRVERKLSVGLARVWGTPDDPRAENLRSESLEDVGDGARGRKASGILMVDGVLYLLIRNADNAQLGWSRDHGATWTWADWRFTTSFGCPTFLNFGRNNAGAPDEYVYVYSFDSDSAYKAADRMVLARAPRKRITDRAAYEFFARIDDQQRPEWSGDISKRGAVLTRKGACYRGGVTYNAPLKTYLWAMLEGGSTERNDRLAVYAADEPWGPWREIFHTDQWDVDPGETASFSPKWISADGRTVHLVFSGDDHFCIRAATLRLAPK